MVIRILKSEKGFAMVMALVIMLIAAVAGVTLWHVGNTDVLEVERDANEVEAFYLAKSGVEIAVGLIKNNIKVTGDYQPPDAFFYGKLGDTSFSNTETPDYSIKFHIDKEGNDFIIESTGYARTLGAEGTQVAANALGFKISQNNLLDRVAGGGGGSKVPPPTLDMIFSLGKIEMIGSPKIVGDTGTNLKDLNSVVFGSSPHSIIESGDLYIGPGGEWFTVVDFSGGSPSTRVPDGSILNLEKVRNYPLPQFPDFPDSLTTKESIELKGNSSMTIANDGYYPKIEISSNTTLEIDTGNANRIIRVGELDVKGDIVLQGTGRLYLYVENNFDFGGNINQNGDFKNVVIYYAGANDLRFTGNQKLFGSIYIKNANLTIGGSTGITGHIVTGGNEVEVSGDARAYSRIIYAPAASLNLNGSAAIKGLAVAKDIQLIGNSLIYYDSSMNMDFFNQLDWGTEESSDSSSWQEVGLWKEL